MLYLCVLGVDFYEIFSSLCSRLQAHDPPNAQPWGSGQFCFCPILVSCHVIDKILCDKVSEIESIYSEMGG